MNFNQQLEKALILLEEPIPNAIEAALDEYMDRYDGDPIAICTHITNDLRNHYTPQLEKLNQQAKQQRRTRNTSGSPQRPTLEQYLVLTLRYTLDPDQFETNRNIGATEQLGYIINDLNTTANALAMGDHADTVDDNTWVKLEGIIDELKSYYTTTIHYLTNQHLEGKK